MKLLTRFSSKILFNGLFTLIYSKRSNKNSLGFYKNIIKLCKYTHKISIIYSHTLIVKWGCSLNTLINILPTINSFL